MKTKQYKTIFSFTLVLMVLTILFANSGFVGVDRYNDLSKTSDLFLGENDKLNYEVLKIRTGVSRHYNTLDEGLNKLNKLMAEMKEISKELKVDQLNAVLKELEKELVVKEEDINHLKSDNGVLRNSLMYFSILSEELLKKSQSFDKANLQTKRFVIEDLTALSNRVIQMVRNPGESVLLSAAEYIEEKLKEAEVFEHQFLKNKIILILKHASVIVDHTGEVNDAVVGIIESGVADKIDRIRKIIALENNRNYERQKNYRLMLFVMSFLLTLYAGYAVYRLKLTGQALKKSMLEMRFQKMATDKHAVICVVDENESIQEVNENYLKVFGCKLNDVIHKKYQDVHVVDNENNDDIVAISSAGNIYKGVVEVKSKNNQPKWFELTVVPFLNEENKLYKKIYIGTDITDRKEAEDRIEYQAFHDELTGLPNRRLLTDRLEQAITQCQTHNHFGALIHLGVDRFKRINDSLGHAAGDYLLIEIAARMSKVLPGATIARLGGDEFLFLIPEISEEIDHGKYIAQRMVSKIQVALNEKFKWKETDLHITPGLGITLFPIDETDPQLIIKEAETALYRAKESGKGMYRFFHPRMQETVENRLLLENDLRKSFEANQLHLNIQPQYNTNGTIIGAETLIRWKHPVRGNVSPAVFIPVAEETGLILTIGRWVIEQACILIRHWQEQFENNLPFDHIAVNVSALQFKQDDFVDMVKEVLEFTEARPDYLELEITEGMLISDVDSTIEKITQLREMGIRFSVDDFGTGYSSLMYLSKLPIEQLKIDRGFVRNIETDKYNAAIVETIISMAKHLNMDVIAEGVETEAELKCLKEMGCFNFQGYYYSMPLEVNVFSDLIAGVHQSQKSKE